MTKDGSLGHVPQNLSPKKVMSDDRRARKGPRQMSAQIEILSGTHENSPKNPASGGVAFLLGYSERTRVTDLYTHQYSGRLAFPQLHNSTALQTSDANRARQFAATRASSGLKPATRSIVRSSKPYGHNRSHHGAMRDEIVGHDRSNHGAVADQISWSKQIRAPPPGRRGS